MGLETGSFVADFVLTNPVSSDGLSQTDDHLRLIKTCVQSTFPGMGGVFNRVEARSTAYSVLSTDNTRHFVIDNSATATVTLSLPAAASITAGFSLMVTVRTGATALIDGNASEQINGATTLTLGDRSAAFLFFISSAAGWRANTFPTGEGGYVFHETLGVSASASFLSPVRFSATVSFVSIIHADGGQVRFPAAQNASSNANTLDDYEEGTWTPAVTYDTPGDLSVTYATQAGTYTKVGRQVCCQLKIETSTFTHTTSAGSMRISGLPFTPGNASINSSACIGSIIGLSISATTQTVTLAAEVEGMSTNLLLRKNVGGATSPAVDPSNHPSGTVFNTSMHLTFNV